MKYIPAGGRVEVLLEELPDGRDNWVRLRITVSDNGCGMEPEFVRHIFESRLPAYKHPFCGAFSTRNNDSPSNPYFPQKQGIPVSVLQGS